MTYWPETRILAANSPSIDAFARWRVSSPRTLFDTVNEYDNGDLFWSSGTASGGAYTHLSNESSVMLQVNGTLGSRVIRQTYEYYRYEPGKSHLIIMTGVWGAPTPGVRKRLGYFDDLNGVFFEQTAAGFSIVLRSGTSGSPNDTVVTQANWNRDTLDGNGPSGLALNALTANIFWFDVEWLGAGRLRVGVWGPDGLPVVAHEFQNANHYPTVYMSTATLPMRYEIENTAAGSVGTLQQICATIQSECGQETAKPYYFGAHSNGALAVTTRQAVMSIRPKLTFGGRTNRVRIIPQDIGTLVTTNDAIWELVYDPTFTGSPTWVDANAHSAAQYSLHTGAGNGAITGGIVVASGFAPAAQGSFSSYEAKGFDFKYPITVDLNGQNPKALSLVCTSLNNTANVRSAINWAEIR